MTWSRGRSGNPGGRSHAQRLFREMEGLVAPTTVESAQPTDLQGNEGPLTAIVVADFLGVGRSRVHQLDDVLQPERCVCGCRVYNPAAVLAYAQKRKLDRAALSRARSARMRELRRRL